MIELPMKIPAVREFGGARGSLGSFRRLVKGFGVLGKGSRV